MKDFTVEGCPDSSLLSLPSYKQNVMVSILGGGIQTLLMMDIISSIILVIRIPPVL